MKRAALALAAVACLFGSIGVAATWDCYTIEQLLNATRNYAPGDEIVIHPGTYMLGAYLQLNTDDVIFRGSTGNPDDVILQGPGMNVDAEPKEGLVIRGNDVTVLDLTVRGIYNNGIHIAGEWGIARTWINNVVTHNIGERHIKGSKGEAIVDDVVIENVHMLQTEARQSRPGHPVDPDNYIGGIDVMAARGWFVRDNVAEGIQGATGGGRGGIFMWNGVENCVVERNQIFDCATGICIGNPSGPTGSHVDPWHSVNNIIRNNMVLRGSYIAFETCNSKDMKVYNNTFYSPDASYFRTLHIYDEPGEGQTTNLDIQNNIIRGKVLDNSSGDWSKAAIIAMGNILDDAGTQVTPSWFVDVNNGDFHLTASATDAIDQAAVLADVTDDFDKETRGANPDMGADEYNPSEEPTVTLSATDPNAAEEGQDTGTFTVSRDDSTGNLVVNYSVGGTAAAGDYEETLTGSVTITDGQLSVDITITPVDDSEVEGSETVVLTLTADPAYVIGSPSSDTVTIADNDGGPPEVFYSNRDNGINNGSTYDNQGARTTVRTAKWGADECYIADFDTAAILAQMGGNPISDYTFKLYIMPSGGWPASAVSVDVQTINTNDDWAEGDDPNRFNSFGWTEGTPAATSEYAQTYHIGGSLDEANCIAWTRENGTPESRFKYLPANFTNSVGLSGSSADHGSYISVVLDENLVNDLLNNAKNRGLRLYRTDGAENLENYTREAAAGQRPYVEVIYVGGALPTVTLSATDASAAEEGQDTGTFTVSRDDNTGNLVVNYSVGGTAAAGDYEETLSGSVTIPDGQLSVDITITPVDDSEVEGDETVILTLTADPAYSIGTPSSGTVTIADNDVALPVVTLSATDPDAAEELQDSGTFTVSRDDSTGNLVVNYSVGGTAAAGDYEETLTGSVTITDGQLSVDITITPVDDSEVEGSETVVLTLTADPAYVIGSPSSDTVTIADNDGGPPEVFNPTRDNGINNGSTYDNQGARTTVRSAKWGADECYIADFDTAAILAQMGGNPISDYTFKLYIMPSGGWPATPATVDVQTINTNDDWAEGDDPNRFNSFGWTEGTPAATSEYAQTYHIGGSLDEANCITWKREDGTPASRFKYLPANFTNSVGLSGSSADHGSYISVVLDANLVNDLLNNAKNRGLRLYRTDGAENLENYTREAAAGQRPYLEVTYVGGALPTVTLSATDDAAAEELQDTGTFTVTRDDNTGNLVVNYSVGGTAAAGDYEETLTGSVTIPDGQLSVDITITPVDDSEVEGDETVILTLTADPAYSIGTPSSGTVTIADNDVALPVVTLSATDDAAAEELQDTGTFTVTRDDNTGNLVVNYSVGGTAAAGDYEETLTGSVTIPDGQLSVDITITPVDDSEVEGDETVILTLTADPAYSIGSPSSGTVTIADNDVPTVTLSATDPDAAEEGQDSGTFTVTRDDNTGNLAVNYSVGGTAAAADYEETLTGSVTIPDGQLSVDITITPVDDSEVEGDETVILTLTADPAYSIGSPSSGTVTITDNDTAGPEQLFFDGFESGNFTAGGWTSSGSASVTGRAAYNGSYGAHIAEVASITKALSTSGYADIHVKCYWKTKGFDSGEYLYCEWSDNGGQNWYELGKTQATSWGQADFTCPAGAANNPDFQVRFRTNASKSNEYGDVDDVEIIGTSQ